MVITTEVFTLNLTIITIIEEKHYVVFKVFIRKWIWERKKNNVNNKHISRYNHLGIENI